MRRSLALVSLAVTLLVVLASLVPVALLVRNQAADRALTRAERDVQAIAAVLAIAPGTTGTETDPDLAEAVLDAFGRQATFSIVFPDGTVVGAPYDVSVNLAQARGGAAFTAQIEGGAEVLVPVLDADIPTAASTIVVRTAVSDQALTEGVGVAWSMLAALAIFLVAVAILAADRLARNIVRPVSALSDAARSLGGGDLETRVDPSGPPEVADVGEAFNFLARRLGVLVSAERESVADLSHRLRTPLTALRLQAETLQDSEESASLLADIDRLERAIDRMIVEARRPSSETSVEDQASDLAAVVRHRATFWKVLADEQGRAVGFETKGGELLVPLGPDELGALVDTLIENVFAHTPPGTAYTIWSGPDAPGSVALIIEDSGPGFPASGLVERGESRGGSTGLGLDIVQQAARRTGGDLTVGVHAGGGARVVVRFGRAPARDARAVQAG